MNKLQIDNEECFLTTNQDYGSFYFGRTQHGQKNLSEIDFELDHNDRVRNERCQFPSITYDIMFDKNDTFEIVSHDKKKNKPIMKHRQLKYIKSEFRTNEKRKLIIKHAIDIYLNFIQCIYKNKQEKNPQLSNVILEIIANELYLLNSQMNSEELADKMIAITVPHEYLGMSSINCNQPYPSKENDCTKTPQLQNLLERFREATKMIGDGKQRFNSNAISRQSLEGTRYIYNPFNSVMESD